MAEKLTRSLRGMRINPPVFFISAAVILAFVLCGALAPEATGAVFTWIQDRIVSGFGWFYMFAVAIFLVFIVGLAVSAYGNVKLGPDHSEPEFSNLAWFSMLFSAGMGIGLMFFGVAEPIMHYAAPPVGDGLTIDAAREAMTITYFHWGVHAWAIYAVIGLSLAYFGFRHKLPLTIRSALYPLIGDRIYGPLGHTVDILAVFGTMFGVATSLGLGVLQVNSGLSYLFGIEQSVTVQLVLIAVITLIATGSVASGLEVGIRRISELNMVLALSLVAFVLLMGPTQFLLQAAVQNTGAYLTHIVDKTFRLYAYEPIDWIAGWTIFYWAWWIAWSPFVGMFIARISRGRTIREFVVGVLGVPVAFTFVWMTVFGNTAIHLDMGAAAGAISAAVSEDVATALFVFLQNFPLAGVVSLVATLLVVTFFVTSSDSGSLVIDIITSGGDTDPPVWQRIFWAVLEGAVAGLLLVAGGLQALQTASITAALPFAFVMLLVCYGLYRGLRTEKFRTISRELPADPSIRGAGVPWQKRLGAIASYPDRKEAVAFLTRVARPALQDFGKELSTRGLDVAIEEDKARRIALTAAHGPDNADFHYAVRLREYETPSFVMAEVARDKAGNGAHSYYRAEVFLSEGGQHYDVYGYSKEQLIADLLAQYQRHMNFLHISRG